MLAAHRDFLDRPHAGVAADLQRHHRDPPERVELVEPVVRAEHLEQRRGEQGYADTFSDYPGFLRPRLEHARRLLAEHGTLYVHLDPRESHYVKVLLDELFGRECFLNEIVWAYDYGGKPRRRWPAKHDTILVYVRDRERYHFDDDEVDREPYMAPGLVGPEKAARGKLPTDVWWHTIVPTNGREKTGYPTQKPEGLVRRVVAASSRPGDWCLDFFAGSGTLGAVVSVIRCPPIISASFGGNKFSSSTGPAPVDPRQPPTRPGQARDRPRQVWRRGRSSRRRAHRASTCSARRSRSSLP